MSHRALGPQFQMMPVADLVPHAADRTSDEGDKRYVSALADSMRKFGYARSVGERTRHAQYMQKEHGSHWVDDNPVTLWHFHSGSIIEPGNHRVAAAHQAGIEQIPVKVNDRRDPKRKP